MKKIVSLLLAGTISMGAIPTALSHYTSELNWRRSAEAASVISKHTDSSCTIDSCIQTETHEHEVCTIDDCTETIYHEHDNTLYLPGETEKTFVCSYSNCTNTEQHAHSRSSKHSGKRGSRHH